MCLRIFRRRHEDVDPIEERFEYMMNLIKPLSRADYNRLKAAMDLGFDSYQKIRNVKTIDEKENEDILEIEKSLQKESKKEGK